LKFQRKKIPQHEELSLGQYKPKVVKDKRREQEYQELSKKELEELLEERYDTDE
jgi:hypothetical protein